MKVRLSMRAQAHLEEAAKWYEDHSPGEGRKFKAALQTCIGVLEAFPVSYPVVDGRMRRAALSNYPYSVFYVIESDHVEVVSVFHDSRKPQDWQVRDAGWPRTDRLKVSIPSRHVG